ncbi:MAG TPA: hypothetical protein VHS58_08135 [Acetobacteraceae bacterium]|jgi:hypothetical protein|nr:hypothetical protein [Acetobacteraceae bacterium]
MRIVALAVASILGVAAQFAPAGAALQCDKLQPLPAQNTDRSFTGKLNAAVDGWFAKLAKIDGGAEGTYRDVSQNVLKEFPQADRLYVWDRVIYLKCQLIADSNDLSTKDKLQAVDQLMNQYNSPPPPVAAAPSYGSINNTGNNATIIQGNGNNVPTR